MHVSSSPQPIQTAYPVGRPQPSQDGEAQVLVLGAGLGGLATALQLSRLGWRVTIIEKEPPPWNRVGESFDWETPVFLKQLGLDLDRMCDQDMLTIKPGVTIWTNTSHRWNEALLLPPPSYMRLLGRNAETYHGNRHRMDQMLLEMVLAAGCRLVIQPIRKVHMQGQAVERVELAGGEELRAPFYIDASGRARLVTRPAGANYNTQGQKVVSLWQRHRHHYDGKGTRLYLLDQGEHMAWIWNIHVDSQTTDIGMVLPAAHYRCLAGGNNGGGPAKSKDEVYWEVLQQVELLSEFADQSRSAGPLRTCSFQNTVADKSGGDNWLAVGESAFIIDPISSGGVTVALRSGKYAASILDEALSKGQDSLPERNRRFYQRRLSLQVHFVNSALEDLYRFRRLWDRIGVPFYVRLLVLPQFHINWLSSNFPLRSRLGLNVLRLFTALLSGTVRGLLYTLRTLCRTS